MSSMARRYCRSATYASARHSLADTDTNVTASGPTAKEEEEEEESEGGGGDWSVHTRC